MVLRRVFFREKGNFYLQIGLKTLPLQSVFARSQSIAGTRQRISVIINKINRDEKNIPTFQAQTPQQTRLPRAHVLCQRTSRIGFTPPSWQKETHCIFRRQVLKTSAGGKPPAGFFTPPPSTAMCLTTCSRHGSCARWYHSSLLALLMTEIVVASSS